MCENEKNSFKLKKFADGNFKFDENGKRYNQFLFSLQCFQKTCTADM